MPHNQVPLGLPLSGSLSVAEIDATMALPAQWW